MMKRLVRFGFAVVGLSTLLGSTSCATAFEGDAHFPGGPSGCFTQCQKIGMEIASFVYVGEYSSACSCRAKMTSGAAAGDARDEVDGAVVAAATGVELQRRRAAQQNSGK